MMTDLAQQRQQILAQIAAACQQTTSAIDSVTLLAVSKTQPSAAIRALYLAGQRAFGENYLQEALQKQQQLTDLSIEWHFIGHVQRNKTRDLAAHFAWVHGVDRLVIAERLSVQRQPEQAPLNLCLQVNIDAETSKDGCLPEQLPQLVRQISALPHVRLRGLMVIPKPDQVDAFVRTRLLFEQLKPLHQHADDWDTLSMGMSADLDAAIAAGATIVRIGTALFGARPAVEIGITAAQQ